MLRRPAASPTGAKGTSCSWDTSRAPAGNAPLWLLHLTPGRTARASSVPRLRQDCCRPGPGGRGRNDQGWTSHKPSLAAGGACAHRALCRHFGSLRSLIRDTRAVMREPSVGQLLLHIVFIVIAMGVLDRFESRPVRTARARHSRHERRPLGLAAQGSVTCRRRLFCSCAASNRVVATVGRGTPCPRERPTWAQKLGGRGFSRAQGVLQSGSKCEFQSRRVRYGPPPRGSRPAASIRH